MPMTVISTPISGMQGHTSLAGSEQASDITKRRYYWVLVHQRDDGVMIPGLACVYLAFYFSCVNPRPAQAGYCEQVAKPGIRQA